MLRRCNPILIVSSRSHVIIIKWNHTLFFLGYIIHMARVLQVPTIPHNRLHTLDAVMRWTLVAIYHHWQIRLQVGKTVWVCVSRALQIPALSKKKLFWVFLCIICVAEIGESGQGLTWPQEGAVAVSHSLKFGFVTKLIGHCGGPREAVAHLDRYIGHLH